MTNTSFEPEGGRVPESGAAGGADRSFVLAFDTANEVVAIGVGLLDASNCSVELAAAVAVEARRASNTQLLPRIDELLHDAGVSREEIACVAVGCGPGSFTGVRIAMATAKGVASALGVGLVGLSSLDAVAWNVWDSATRGELLVVADAMRKEVYPVRYLLSDAGAQRLTADRVEKADAAAAEFSEGGASACANGLLVAGDGLRKYEELFSACGTVLDPQVWTPTGEGLLLALQAAWRTGECDPFDARRHNPAFALPVYTRLSDAEEAERKRLARVDQTLAGMRGSKHVTMNDMSVPNERANDDGIAYKPLDAVHAEAVADLEGRVMGSDAWNAPMVVDELGRADRVWWAAYAADPDLPVPDDARLAGYAGGMIVDSDVQILKVGVDPAFRRRGIARELVGRVASDARNLGARTASLEVRVLNEGAQGFYRALGFEGIGERPRYYSDGEAALIMKADALPVADHDVAGMDIQRHESAAMQAASAAAHPAAAAAGETVAADGAASDGAAPGAFAADAGATPVEGAVSPVAADAKASARPLILAIESSCDETAAAIVDGEGRLLSDVVASQIDFHARFGGVVPEIASRKHIEAICGVCDECLDVAADALGTPQLSWRDLDAVAVTYAPGLVGALVVGVAFAKGAAWALDVPFIGVNHLEGHLYANKIGDASFAPPAVVSLVSGGNTMLVHMRGWGDYETLGTTIDDAVGEAFDKVAKALGLGYPGGPVISRFAAEGDPDAIPFPRAMLHSGDLRFSLSGLKTAVVTYINQERAAGREPDVADVAASFQQAVVDVQVAKAKTALEQTGAKTFCLGGGVAANPVLRRAYEDLCAQMGVKLVMPPLHSCGDNAGMIALVALDRFRAGKFFELDADAHAHTDLDEPY